MNAAATLFYLTGMAVLTGAVIQLGDTGYSWWAYLLLYLAAHVIFKRVARSLTSPFAGEKRRTQAHAEPGTPGSSATSRRFHEDDNSPTSLGGIGAGLAGGYAASQAWADNPAPSASFATDITDDDHFHRTSTIDDDPFMNSDSPDSHTGFSGRCINPATGLPMVGDSCAGVDMGGNPYGFDNDSLHSDSTSTLDDHLQSSGFDDNMSGSSFDDDLSSSNAFDDSSSFFDDSSSFFDDSWSSSDDW